MRTAILLLVLTVAQMFLQGCASDPATTQPVPPVKTIVAGTDDLVFALVPGKCVDRQCAAVIQLRSSRKLLDSADLVFAASDAGLRKAEGDSQIGPGIDLDAWTAGTEDGTVTTAVQGVRLTERRVGFLVHQVGGFEHLK